MTAGMEMRPLGRSLLQVPRLGLGCATFGREIDEATSFKIMDYAVERDIRLFDTAEAYGGGEARDYRKSSFQVDDVREVSAEYHSSEKTIGRWIRAIGARDRITLVSKITSNFTRAHVREALQASLERLQTDYLDVYMFHRFDTEAPIEEALEAMDEAQESGLVRCAGCSNFTAGQLGDALDASRRLGVRRLEVVEAICNLAAREVERDLLPLCSKEQVGFLGFSPLGAGFLSGKYTGDRNAFPPGTRFDVIPGHADVYFHDQKFKVAEQLHCAAARMGVPALRLAIAWVLAHLDVTTVLFGARETAHVDNALAAYRMEMPVEWPIGMNPIP